MSEYFRKPIVKTLMLKGQAGQSIKGIEKTRTDGFVDTYTITLTDGTTSTFTVTNGREISDISKTGTSGLVDTYTITFNDGATSTFTVTNGKEISGVSKTGTSGLVDTYTIKFNDGTTSTFTVTNGAKGDKGEDSKPAVDALEKRLDNLILSSGNESSAEVIDARTGYDGTAYKTLGTAIRTQINKLNEKIVNILDTDNLVPDVLYKNVKESWGEAGTWFYNWTNKYTYTVSKSEEILFKGFPTLSVQLSNAAGKNIVINHSINLEDYIGKEVYAELWLYVDGESIPEMAQIGIGGTVLNFDNFKSGWNSVKGTIFTPAEETIKRIRLVVGGNCHVYFSPLLLTYNEYTKLTVEETTQEIKKELNRLSNDYTPELILPDVIPCVTDKQIMIYYDNAILYSSLKNIERIKADINKSPYDNMVDKWFWNPSSDDDSFTNAFRMYTKNTKEYAQEARCLIQNVSKTSGSGKSKKCLFIGDSITQYGGYLSELLNLFKTDVANIELLGTRESTYIDSSGQNRTVVHEGRGGWSSKDYCTASEKNGVSNPFYNSNKFDFNYYMNNANYSDVDYVFIMLGTNDLSDIKNAITYFDEIYNSIKAFNSNIIVFISLCPALSSRVDTFDMKNTRLLFTKELIKKYGGKRENGVFLLPLYLVIDPENDFPNDNTIYDSTRHSVVPYRITDNTHMTKYGHYKMADLIYYTIKYAMQLIN